MPIGLGMASSHAPSLKATTYEDWETIHKFLNSEIPQPASTLAETEEVIEGWIPRIAKNFKTLEDQIKANKTDLLVIIGGDQTEMFDRSNVPNLMMFLGEEAWGQNNNGLAGEPASEKTMVRLKVDVATSKRLLEYLVIQEGFDMNFSDEQKAMGRIGSQRGTPHAFITPAPYLMPELNIPTVLIYENTYDPPSLTAQRCYDLGRAIARFFKNDPRRIAIYGSGGMSHDPRGPRSGWVDEPLDRWFLKQIEEGTTKNTTALYTFDSMTMRAGTGELRAWITAAGAVDEMGHPAGTVVDYFPSGKSTAGLGWVYWNPAEKATAATA